MHSFAPSWRTVIRVTGVEVVPLSLFPPPGSGAFGEVQVLGFHILVELIKVYVGRQGAHDAPLWGAGQGVCANVSIHHTSTQEFPEQCSDIPIGYFLLDRLD